MPVIGRNQDGWVKPVARELAKGGKRTTTYEGIERRKETWVKPAVERFRQERVQVELKAGAQAGLTGAALQERAERNAVRQAERYKNAIFTAHNRRWAQAAAASAKSGSRPRTYDARHDPNDGEIARKELRAAGRGKRSSSQAAQMERQVQRWHDKGDPRAKKRTWRPAPGHGNGRRSGE